MDRGVCGERRSVMGGHMSGSRIKYGEIEMGMGYSLLHQTNSQLPYYAHILVVVVILVMVMIVL